MRQNGVELICSRCGKSFEGKGPVRKSKLCPECDKALDEMAGNIREKLVACGLLSPTPPQKQ